MVRCFGVAIFILASVVQARSAPRAGDTPADSWVEARSPHFIVVSNASGDQARSVAIRFERVRAVFQKAFPGMRVYPDLPIVILAARDRATFQELSPPGWSKQGEISRSGMMLRNPDKNFILLLLGVPGENPYHVVYHEYAHLVLEDDFRNIPLWLNEGLAEFYGNSEIDRKTVRLGLPSKENLALLREHPWLPLETLFTVDQSSPYYNEEDKGSIFYAESWALTDYLMFVKRSNGKGPIDRYLALVSQRAGPGSDPVTAATETFGDLHDLEAKLQNFVKRSAFGYFRLKIAAGDDSYTVEQLSPAESEALRGDFMARTGSAEAARPLLLDALRRDPELTSINQSLGLLEVHERHVSEAARWFAKAAALCSNCVFSRFYNALALMQQDPGRPNDADRQTIESGFEAFIRFNPTFAPAYAALARFYVTSGKNPSGALDLAAKASSLDPRNVRYLFLEADILLKTGDKAGALRVAHQAVATAQSPAEKSQAYLFLGAVQQKMEAEAGKP